VGLVGVFQNLGEQIQTDGADVVLFVFRLVKYELHDLRDSRIILCRL
jgi:hypothetical protein